MITYNDIYEALRKEKYSEQLQPLQRTFIQDVSEYFEDKKRFAEKDPDMFSETMIKTKKQFENAISIFNELITRRKKKILTLAFVAVETGISKKDYENMIDFEKEMFDKIVKNLEESDKSINESMNGQKEDTTIMVSFKENLEDFMDSEGNKLGPFEKGDIANLPAEIAKILVESGRAEEVEE